MVMNNEPVAWKVIETDDDGSFTTFTENEPVWSDNAIPLYAHPVKEQDESFDRTASHMAGEYVSWTSCVACGQKVTGDSIHTCSPQLKQLTDEEIEEFAYAFQLWQLHNPDKALEGIMDFARAILRKAQDK